MICVQIGAAPVDAANRLSAVAAASHRSIESIAADVVARRVRFD